MRKLLLLVVMAVAALGFTQTANAAIPDALGISCTTKDNSTPAYEGQRWCGTGDYKQSPADIRSTVQSFDGVPIDVNVAFPATGGDGPYPLVMMFHGYGGGKVNFPGMQRWLNKGYAVFSQTNRGFHESCGTALAKAADPDCATKGFVRLDDTRYEVRDAQLFAGMLANEGLIEPTRIAATGGSYGGGMSMALAALKDRTMMPDGTLVPWTSPAPQSTPMSLAVAIPNIPWTDLAYSLVPNGSNFDYIEDASYYGRFGVMKQSYVNGLYLSGLTAPGYYTAPGLQPSADLSGWKVFMDKGEPYDGTAAAEQMLNEVTNYHSSYYIDHSVPPAPLMISSGFTDDLFPANEATRYYNRTRAQYPNTPLALFFGDFGHMRAANKDDVHAALTARENEWVDHYLAGIGSKPPSNVTTYTQTCPDTQETPSGGPYVASDWASSSPGEIRLKDDGGAQMVAPDGGTREVGAAFNPAPSGKSCTAAAGAREPGTANYELDPAPAGGYTVLGSPTVVAKITQAGNDSQIAARLVDVSPDGNQKTLVNRALWRPANSGFQVFQLNPNAWKVKQGHVLRLELLPMDGGGDATALLSNFGRPSNNQQPATIEKVDLRVPVKETPGALGGLVKAPVKKVLPDRPGVELARGYERIGSETLAEYKREVEPVAGKIKLRGRVTVKRRILTARIRCAGRNDYCTKRRIVFKGAPKRIKKSRKGRKARRARRLARQARGLRIAKTRRVTVKPGQTRRVRFRLTRRARKFFRNEKVRRHGHKVVKRGPRSLRTKVRIGGKRAGFKYVKRVGRVR